MDKCYFSKYLSNYSLFNQQFKSTKIKKKFTLICNSQKYILISFRFLFFSVEEKGKKGRTCQGRERERETS